MTKETEEAIDSAIEKNNEQWRTRIKYEKGKLVESAVTLGVIASLTAFVIGWLVGAKIGL